MYNQYILRIDQNLKFANSKFGLKYTLIDTTQYKLLNCLNLISTH